LLCIWISAKLKEVHVRNELCCVNSGYLNVVSTSEDEVIFSLHAYVLLPGLRAAS